MITSSFLIKETNELLVLGDDSAFYVYGKGQSLFKIDSNGNVKWKKKIAGNCITYFNSIVPANNSDQILIVGTNSIRPTPNDFCYSKYCFRTYDKVSGAFISETISDDSIPEKEHARIDDAKLLANGNIMSLGLPESMTWSSANPKHYWEVYGYEQQVMLFNRQTGDLIRRKKIIDLSAASKYLSILYKTIPLRDGGALMLGQYIDSLPEDGNLSRSRYGCTLIKLNDNLETKWVRNYTYQSGMYNSFHADAVEDSQNGIWLAGYICDTNFMYKGWIMHTDSFGCAVTGCHLHDGIQILNPGAFNYLNVYPNPVEETINLTINNVPIEEGFSLVLMNGSGEVMTSQTLKRDARELSINVKGLDAGLYYLLLLTDGKLLEGEKVIVNHK